VPAVVALTDHGQAELRAQVGAAGGGQAPAPSSRATRGAATVLVGLVLVEERHEGCDHSREFGPGEFHGGLVVSLSCEPDQSGEVFVQRLVELAENRHGHPVSNPSRNRCGQRCREVRSPGTGRADPHRRRRGIVPWRWPSRFLQKLPPDRVRIAVRSSSLRLPHGDLQGAVHEWMTSFCSVVAFSQHLCRPTPSPCRRGGVAPAGRGRRSCANRCGASSTPGAEPRSWVPPRAVTSTSPAELADGAEHRGRMPLTHPRVLRTRVGVRGSQGDHA
jgi:hypothetical protein